MFLLVINTQAAGPDLTWSQRTVFLLSETQDNSMMGLRPQYIQLDSSVMAVTLEREAEVQLPFGSGVLPKFPQLTRSAQRFIRFTKNTKTCVMTSLMHLLHHFLLSLFPRLSFFYKGTQLFAANCTNMVQKHTIHYLCRIVWQWKVQWVHAALIWTWYSRTATGRQCVSVYLSAAVADYSRSHHH